MQSGVPTNSMVVGVVLAGGFGTRMNVKNVRPASAGTCFKGSLRVAGVPIIREVFRTVSEVFPRRIVSVGSIGSAYSRSLGGHPQIFRDARRLGFDVVVDRYEGMGPLAGLDAALAHTGAPCFVLACDMPFISSGLIRYMCGLLGEFDAVVPAYGGYIEPAFALYALAAAPHIKEHLAAGKRCLSSVLAGLKVRWVCSEEIARFGEPRLLFFNVNTPEDLEEADRISELRKIEKTMY